MSKILINIGVLFIIILSYYYNDIINFFFDIYIIEKRKESHHIETYYKICKSEKLLIKNKTFNKVEIPKISIISPVYNRGNYILRFLRSIQNQGFEDIEIIFIDDYSTDNSVKLIEKYQKEDKRIVLLKNKRNKGTLNSRNQGVLYSKGKYIILPDPDDILSKDILQSCYEIAIKNNYDLVRFNIYLGNDNIFFESIVNSLENGPIYHPQISSYLFYGKGILQQIDFNITNKLIKRIIFIKAISTMNIYYFNLYMTNQEDGLINFLIYRNINSYYFLKKIGYYYLPNKNSITLNFQKNYDETIKFIFINLIFVFENTKNNKFEKDMANCLLERLYEGVLSECLNLITKDFKYYIYIINQYLSYIIFKLSFFNNSKKSIIVLPI